MIGRGEILSMNNEETKKQSCLELPDWKRVRVPEEIERLAAIVVDSAFHVHPARL
jgi:hypothetical protein